MNEGWRGDAERHSYRNEEFIVPRELLNAAWSPTRALPNRASGFTIGPLLLRCS
jgi:hypothetical protein